MQTSATISSWLVLGPIYNQAHQADKHWDGDGHPVAADIIMDIDDNLLNPIALTTPTELIVEKAPKEGDTTSYGNGKYFNAQTYTWRGLSFAYIDWKNVHDIEDDIHNRLGVGIVPSDPQDPLSFAGKHHTLAFFLVYIVSPDARKSTLCLRSDDASRVWLNGQELQEPLRFIGNRDINEASAESCAEISLSQGLNILLCAVAETHVEWGFSARIENAEGLIMSTTKPLLELFTVKGQIQRADGNPLAGAAVEAFDKDLSGETQLGSRQMTGQDGRYEITYDSGQFRRPTKSAATLVVRVYWADQVVAQSPIIKAKPVEIVDLTVTGEEFKEHSEYEKLLDQLTPILGTLPLATLSGEQITVLSVETGVDRQRIDLLVTAAGLAEATQLPVEVVYGLARQGLPASLPALLAQSSDAQRRALEAALRDNIIPASVGEDLDGILARLQQLAVEQALDEREEAGGPPLGRLLNATLTPLSRELKESFARAYLQHRGPMDGFWEDLAQRPEFQQEGLLEDLRFTLHLGDLTQHHHPLIGELQRLRRDGTLQLPRDLARFDVAAWADLINQQREGRPIAAPSAIPGEDAQEKARNYAERIARTVEQTFPTAAVAYRVVQENRPRDEHLVSFFNNHLQDPKLPEFDFATTHVERYLANNADAVLAGVGDQQGLTQQLKSLQRVFKVTPRYPEMRALLADGVHSAQGIVQIGASGFIERYGEPLGGKERAAQVFDTAHRIAATSLALLAKYARRSTVPPPR